MSRSAATSRSSGRSSSRSRRCCTAIGRDPATIGKSAGIVVEPTSVTGAADVLAQPLRGAAEEIADGLRAFRAGGFTQVEVLLWPRTVEALDAMAPVLELLDAD